MFLRSLSRTSARSLAVLTATAMIGTLAACAPGVPDAAVDPGDSTPSAESPSPLADESTDPASDPVALLRSNLSAAISTGDTDALEVAFTDPVRVVIASSEADSQIAPLDAVLALDYIQPGVGTWEWDLPTATIDGYRASEYYSDFFPADVIVGRSSEGPVVAFSPDGERIDVILMAIDEDLLFF